MNQVMRLVAGLAGVCLCITGVCQSAGESVTGNDTNRNTAQSTKAKAETFKPVDTSRPDFQVTLEDIRRTWVQDFLYTPPVDPQPIDLLENGLESDLKKTTDPKRRASILLTLATMSSYAAKGPSPSVQRKYLSEALTVSRDANYAEAEAVAHGKLAMVEECLGNIEAAQKEIQLALKFHRGMKMKSETAIDLCNWGMILGKNNKPEEALLHLEEALSLARASKDDIAVAFTLCNLGACSQKTDLVSSLKKELQHYGRLCLPFFLYYRKINLGGMYMSAIKGKHVFNNQPNYDPEKNDSLIPLGYIEAPYEIPWPKRN